METSIDQNQINLDIQNNICDEIFKYLKIKFNEKILRTCIKKRYIKNVITYNTSSLDPDNNDGITFLTNDLYYEHTVIVNNIEDIDPEEQINYKFISYVCSFYLPKTSTNHKTEILDVDFLTNNSINILMHCYNHNQIQHNIDYYTNELFNYYELIKLINKMTLSNRFSKTQKEFIQMQKEFIQIQNYLESINSNPKKTFTSHYIKDRYTNEIEKIKKGKFNNNNNQLIENITKMYDKIILNQKKLKYINYIEKYSVANLLYNDFSIIVSNYTNLIISNVLVKQHFITYYDFFTNEFEFFRHFNIHNYEENSDFTKYINITLYNNVLPNELILKLELAANNGDYEFIINNYYTNISYNKPIYKNIINNAMLNGHIDILNFCIEHNYNIKFSEFFDKLYESKNINCLIWICNISYDPKSDQQYLPNIGSVYENISGINMLPIFANLKSNLLTNSIKYNIVEFVDYLYDNDLYDNNLYDNDLYDNDFKYQIQTCIICLACENNCKDVLDWAISKNLCRIEDIKYTTKTLDILEYVYKNYIELFELESSIDIDIINDMIQYACKYGNVESLEWILNLTKKLGFVDKSNNIIWKCTQKNSYQSDILYFEIIKNNSNEISIKLINCLHNNNYHNCLEYKDKSICVDKYIKSKNLNLVELAAYYDKIDCVKYFIENDFNFNMYNLICHNFNSSRLNEYLSTHPLHSKSYFTNIKIIKGNMKKARKQKNKYEPTHNCVIGMTIYDTEKYFINADIDASNITVADMCNSGVKYKSKNNITVSYYDTKKRFFEFKF